MSTRAFRLTSSTTPDCTYFLKPWRLASTLYEPSGRAVNEYSPLASDFPERVKFVSALTTVTSAPPTTAPERSVTVPKMPAVDTCAANGEAVRQSTTASPIP